LLFYYCVAWNDIYQHIFTESKKSKRKWYYSSNSVRNCQIESFISNFPDVSIICGGDFNVDLLKCNQHVNRGCSTLQTFIDDLLLKECNKSQSEHNILLDYTYRHETLNQSSYIDYFIDSEASCTLMFLILIC